MDIQIRSRFTDVPGYIIHFMKEKLVLANLEENRINEVSVTFKEISIFDVVKYFCVVDFKFCGRSVLITRSGECYFEAVVDVNKELFDKIQSFSAV